MDYLLRQNEVTLFIEDIYLYLKTWLPTYMNKERSYLTISIGCTGGKHRSVYCAEKIAESLSEKWRILIRHRKVL